jgi:hypothetical protein
LVKDVLKIKSGAGEVAQVIESLLSKHEVVSSNASATKKKKND